MAGFSGVMFGNPPLQGWKSRRYSVHLPPPCSPAGIRTTLLGSAGRLPNLSCKDSRVQEDLPLRGRKTCPKQREALFLLGFKALLRRGFVGHPAIRRGGLSCEARSAKQDGGEDGIRTHEKLLTSTPLAGERLRPLGHLSVAPLDKEKRGHNQQAPANISEKEAII